MPTPAEAAKNTVEVSKRHVIDQHLRIERHLELLAKLSATAIPTSSTTPAGSLPRWKKRWRVSRSITWRRRRDWHKLPKMG